ncbi:MAG: hypothetical protein IPP59_15075 [Betaproteobacteria bacterium]|nr:hypothetical protein [Candidatus Dechloromonas phosphorivorans]
MKADLSRATFDKARRYRSVRMQQGRVQLDADFNEQQDILNHRLEIETRDSLGPVAVPIDNPGFGLSPAGTDLTISAGRLYVDGLLCENPEATTVANQPDLPDTASPVLPTGATLLPLPPKGIKASDITGVVVFNNAGQAVPPADGTYLAYLETWQRHLSPLDLPVDDPSMREVALGGPDTCTREKTVWQVKLLRAGDNGAALDCLSNIAAWTALTAAPDGRLAARAEASIPPKTPCQLPPEAGYRLLENHLYRVEIHDDGNVTGKARYKWSRDNGSLLSRVVRWLDDPIANEFEVASIGRDDVLAITAGCWVEFIDDTHELLGQPGPLVPVVRTEGNVVTVDLTKLIGHALDPALFPTNPRVRRWDGIAEIRPAAIANPNTGWEELAQDGIELKFAPGSYRIGDYWLIPARTATASIEWPQESGKPAFRAPAGVLRGFARLALLEFKSNAWTLKSDCRPLFPSLTEFTQLHYVGGDGQSVKANPVKTALLVERAITLQVGVANGQFPVAKAQVRFTVETGQLPNGSKTQDVPTNNEGIATIDWLLASDPGNPIQHATAQLLVIDQLVPGRYLPVHFTAQLALASEVSYDPSGCPELLAAEAFTVQAAIDTLCKRPQSGGCCVTVGLAGEFETLDAALRTLLGEDRRDICICLLPGNHSLADGMSLTGTRRHNISIHGAGRATRLNLKEEIFQFDTFGSLSLQDFIVVNAGEPRSFSFQHCQDLHLNRVEFFGRSATGTSLLQISGTARLLINSCMLFAISTENNEKLGFVFERLPSLLAHRAAFSPLASIDGNLSKAAEAIAALSPEERKKMAGEISNLIRGNDAANLSNREQTSLNQLRVLVSRESKVASLIKALDEVASALRAGTPAFALALDETADATLIDNRLRGRITLFGESDEMPVLNADQLKRLSGAIREGVVTLDDSGSLVLERNLLQGMRISGKALEKVVESAEGTLPVWHNLQVINNRIDSEEDHYPGFNCAFNGNTLEPEGDVGVLFGNQAKIIGNFADNKFRLFAAGTNPESFGNGALNVVVL